MQCEKKYIDITDILNKIIESATLEPIEGYSSSQVAIVYTIFEDFFDAREPSKADSEDEDLKENSEDELTKKPEKSRKIKYLNPTSIHNFLKKGKKHRLSKELRSHYQYLSKYSDILKENIRGLINNGVCISDAASAVHDYVGDSLMVPAIQFLQEKYTLYTLKHDLECCYEYLSKIIHFSLAFPVPDYASNDSPYWDAKYFFTDTGCPNPCVPFEQRSDLIEEIHQKMPSDKPAKAFLSGFYCMGKSELAKAYANTSLERKKYNEVLFLDFDLSLNETIRSLHARNDLFMWENSPAVEEHLFILDHLGPKTLLVINHYDDIETDSKIYQRIMKLKCHVLFTTTSPIDVLNQAQHILVGPLADPLSLFKNHYNFSINEQPVIEKILQRIENNTGLAVLIASCLNPHNARRNTLTAEKVLEMLSTNIANINSGRIRWGNNMSKARLTFMAHVDSVLRFDRFILTPDQDVSSTPEVHILQFLSLCPRKGVSEKLLLDAIEPHLNSSYERLLDVQLISKSGSTVTLPLLVRDLVRAKYPPGYKEISPLLNSITEFDLRAPFLVNTADHCLFDNPSEHVRFAFSAFQYLSEHYSSDHNMHHILKTMRRVIDSLDCPSAAEEYTYHLCFAKVTADSTEALQHLFTAQEHLLRYNKLDKQVLSADLNLQIADRYIDLKDPDKALHYAQKTASLLDGIKMFSEFNSIAIQYYFTRARAAILTGDSQTEDKYYECMFRSIINSAPWNAFLWRLLADLALTRGILYDQKIALKVANDIDAAQFGPTSPIFEALLDASNESIVKGMPLASYMDSIHQFHDEFIAY